MLTASPSPQPAHDVISIETAPTNTFGKRSDAMFLTDKKVVGPSTNTDQR
jgi:hypothetical protein